jgi:hypothetical protein
VEHNVRGEADAAFVQLSRSSSRVVCIMMGAFMS